MNWRTPQALIVALSCVTLLSGCFAANAPSGKSSESSNSESQQPSNSESVASAWNCETKEDGLGETTACQSRTKDADGTYWILTLMCNSELETLHSILGMKADASFITWDSAVSNKAQVRLDSGKIAEWKYLTKGQDGTGLVFSNVSGQKQEENSLTWDFLSMIASTKTFGFKAYDATGVVRSARFDVQGSVPVAASFSAMGCHG